MPKVVTLRDLPPPPPTIDVTKLSDAERAVIKAQFSDAGGSWSVDGCRLPGVPWWIETTASFFMPRDIMLATGLSRSAFIRYHESGAIRGATWAFTGKRQVKKQPVVRRLEYLRAAVDIGDSWFIESAHLVTLPEPKLRAARTLHVRVTDAEIMEILERRRRMPQDVLVAYAIDDETGFCTWVRFHANGRIDSVGAGA